MPEDKKNEYDIIIKFGAGINSSASEDEIGDREAADGFNYELDLNNSNLVRRKPFDLIGQVPNGSQIRGGATLQKVDGTISFLIQAGDTVYEWDGLTTFTSVGTVNVNANLRGRLEHNWLLDDKVFITDLSLQQQVMEWDGATFQPMSHNLTGLFKAKYCSVSGERALFSNVVSNSVATPNILVASEISDNTSLSITDRPSSSLGEGDPFYVVTPDLKGINGLVDAFGFITVSTENGSIFTLTGSSAKDFKIGNLYPRSFASGDESLIFAGNDILYGRPGRIESVVASDKYGDVQNDDISNPIADKIRTYYDWTAVYNSRFQRVYFYPDGQSKIFTLFKPIKDSSQPKYSPWVEWNTQHESSFNPTFMMNMLDPLDGLEYTFFGDSSGNLYRMEGLGDSGDAGTAEIIMERLSGSLTIPADQEAFKVEGYIKYRKNLDATIELIFEYAGYNIFNQTVTVSIFQADANYYGGEIYYGGEFFYGVKFEGKLTRKKIMVAGRGSDIQLRVRTTGVNDIEISEVGIKFNAAT